MAKKKTTPADPLLVGQLEALLPRLAAAKAAAEAAKAAEAAIRAEIEGIMGPDPQTVETAWGTVTLAAGARRQTVVCPALKARLALLQAEGLATGATVITVGAPTLRVKFS